jgi:hypothetical protein
VQIIDSSRLLLLSAPKRLRHSDVFLFFMVCCSWALMTYFYEMFLYNPRTFGALQPSTMFSFGFSGLLCFGLPIL